MSDNSAGIQVQTTYFGLCRSCFLPTAAHTYSSPNGTQHFLLCLPLALLWLCLYFDYSLRKSEHMDLPLVSTCNVSWLPRGIQPPDVHSELVATLHAGHRAAQLKIAVGIKYDFLGKLQIRPHATFQCLCFLLSAHQAFDSDNIDKSRRPRRALPFSTHSL